MSINNYQGAIGAYTQVIRLKPSDPTVYFQQGVTRFLIKDYPSAILDYSEAIRLNPDPGFYYQRGFVHSVQGELQAAVEDYTQVIRLKPDFIQAYGSRAYARSKLGDQAGAIADFQTIAQHYAAQGDQEGFQRTIENIRKLQRSSTQGLTTSQFP